MTAALPNYSQGPVPTNGDSPIGPLSPSPSLVEKDIEPSIRRHHAGGQERKLLLAANWFGSGIGDWE
jgi:hypothetical protein